MADEAAFPTVLRSVFGSDAVGPAVRPGKTKSEKNAKRRLGEWTRAMLGEPMMREGLEYAYETGRATRPHHVGAARNPDLRRLLQEELPAFFEECDAARRSG